MNVIFCILSDGISGNHGCSGQQIRKDPATFKEMRFKRTCDVIPYIHANALHWFYRQAVRPLFNILKRSCAYQMFMCYRVNPIQTPATKPVLFSDLITFTTL